MLESIHYFIILLLLIIIGLCSYITYKIKDNDKKADKTENFSEINNYKLSPGDGYNIVDGGNPKDMMNTNDKFPYENCEKCLKTAFYDPSAKYVNKDPAYYYNNQCWHSTHNVDYDDKDASIAYKGINVNTALNKYTCDAPGKISF